jgi:hypothetical protein
VDINYFNILPIFIFDLDIIVKNYIIEEIQQHVEATLVNLQIERPNVAKVAGAVAFRIRKLKPFSYAHNEIAQGEKLYVLNELIAVQTN